MKMPPENTKSPWLAFVAIMVLAAGFTVYSAFQESAIMDELAHIPAGYGYVRYLDYRLNPEHPPLLKALSGLPLLFANLKFPTDSRAWTSDVNGQWEVGSKFLYESGNNANQIIRWARLGPILLTLLLVVLIYLWSRELLGKWWALIPTFLFALSPNVLAHGHYVTTDVAAAFGVVLATYFFLKFLHRPSKRHLIYAGLAFGVAQLAKFSAVLLLPYFALLILVFYLVSLWSNWQETAAGERLRRFGVRAWHYCRATLLVFAIGYALIVYPVYALFTLNYPADKQTADTEFILTSFAGGPTPPGEICKPMRCLAETDIWLTKNPATRPAAEYLLGVLMVLQRSAGGNTAYSWGEVSAAGSLWYFPVSYLLKEPLPTLLLVLFALLLGLKNTLKAAVSNLRLASRRFRDYLNVNFSEFSILLFVVLYWAWSMRSPLNIGFRHLFPTLPFIYILAAGAWKKWLSGPGTATRSVPKYAVLVLLFLWFAGEVAVAAPNFLSYFNQLGGGVHGGYRYITDSNYDWGQDLLHLKKFADSRPDAERIAVDYFGGGNPKYYLGEREENWRSSRGNPAEQGIKWLAVSVNTLQGAIQPTAPGFLRRPEDEYRWLTELRPPKPGIGNVPEPDYRAGTSIFIYKLQ